MFTYEIRSTIDVSDHSDTMKAGTVLISGDPDETFATAAEAEEFAQDVLNGLSGGRAFNAARDSAEVVAIEVDKAQS